ncbi:MAG: hypothetical protein JWR72_1495 [Flavisolibacter sp.]|nr:hypothetical protein [Flavisolibacter sp.]
MKVSTLPKKGFGMLYHRLLTNSTLTLSVAKLFNSKNYSKIVLDNLHYFRK